MNQNRLLTLAAGLLLTCGFLFFAFIVLPGFTRMASPTPTQALDLLATLSALTPSSTASPAFPTSSATTGVAVLPDEPTGEIVFTCQIFKVQAANQICIMNADGSGYRRLTTDNRDGGNPRHVFDGLGWDPTWSPDGKQILFASERSGSNQLWIGDLDGSDLQRVGDLPALRGRSDWSPQNLIVTYSGESWGREIYAMNVDGSNQHQISPGAATAKGPPFHQMEGGWRLRLTLINSTTSMVVKSTSCAWMTATCAV